MNERRKWRGGRLISTKSRARALPTAVPYRAPKMPALWRETTSLEAPQLDRRGPPSTDNTPRRKCCLS